MRHSSMSIFRRTSERTRASSARSSTGLVRNSSAPASSPSTRSSGRSSAVTITTGMCVQRGSALIRRQTSKPVIPGIITSSSTISGGSTSITASAEGPSSAVTTSKYSAVSFACRSRTLTGASSTTRMRALMRALRSSGEMLLNGLEKPRNGDGLGDVVLAAALPDLFLVAFHGESGHRNHRDVPKIVVLLQPLGDLEPGNFRELDVHQDEIGPMIPGDREDLYPVARLQRPVAMGFQKVVEELHIKLVVLDDDHCLRHPTSPEPRRRPNVRKRCPLQRRVAACIRHPPKCM